MLQNDNKILDIIETDHRHFRGVVDYITTKHVVIYDLTGNDDPNLTMMVIMYKLYFKHIRFSLYKSLFFSHFHLPTPLLVNKKNIKKANFQTKTNKPERKVFKVTKRF